MKNNNKLFWGIVIIALLLLFYLIFTYKEQPFDKYEIGKDNIISNRTNIEYLDTIVHVGLDILGIKNHVILIREQEEEIDLGDDIKTEAYVITKGIQSIIYIKERTNRLTNIQVLAHELIHIDQVKSGRYIADTFPFVIFDDSIYVGNKLPYRDRPWEEDAYLRGRDLEKEIKSILYESK